KLEGGPRILVTHFPVCLASGKREKRTHGLRDLEAVSQVAAAGGIDLWLHGHRHKPYSFQQGQNAPFSILCGGSSTQAGIGSYYEYQLEDLQLQATRRAYDFVSGRFQDQEKLVMPLEKSRPQI